MKKTELSNPKMEKIAAKSSKLSIAYTLMLTILTTLMLSGPLLAKKSSKQGENKISTSKTTENTPEPNLEPEENQSIIRAGLSFLDSPVNKVSLNQF